MGGRRARDPLLLAAIGVTVAVVTSLWAVLVPGYTVWPDELGYVRGATYLSEHGPLIPAGDLYYTSASQMLQLTLAPLQLLFGGVDSVRAAHVLFALIIASSVAPGWILARELQLPRGSAFAGAALVTVTSWLSFAGTITTEVLAWPLFLWVLLAMVRAVAAPGPGRDAVAVAAIGVATFARLQFIVLAAVLVLAIVVDAAAQRRRLRSVAREHRLLIVVIGTAGATAALVALSGLLGDPLGFYGAVFEQRLVGSEQARSALNHFVYLALATGVVPLILTVAWVAQTLRSPSSRVRAAFAALTATLAVVVVAQVGAFGATYLQGVTGRYVFYLAIPVFLGLLLCLDERRVEMRSVLLATGLVLAATATASIGALETAVRAPEVGSGSAPVVTGDRFLGVPHARVLLSLAVLAAGGVGFALIRVVRPRPALAVCTAGLLALGAGSAALRMRSILNESRAKDVVAEPGWIDDAGASPGRVALALGPLSSAGGTELTWKSDAFFNRSVGAAWALPRGSSYDQRFVQTIVPDRRTGRLPAPPGPTYAVVSDREVRFGLRGPVVRAYGGRRLVRVGSSPRLAWFAPGVSAGGRVAPTAVLLAYRPRRGDSVRVAGRDRAGGRAVLRRKLPAGGVARVPIGRELARVDRVRLLSGS